MFAAAEDSEHPVITSAYEWEIVGLNWQDRPMNGDEPFLDLTLVRDTARTRTWPLLR